MLPGAEGSKKKGLICFLRHSVTNNSMQVLEPEEKLRSKPADREELRFSVAVLMGP